MKDIKNRIEKGLSGFIGDWLFLAIVVLFSLGALTSAVSLAKIYILLMVLRIRI